MSALSELAICILAAAGLAGCTTADMSRNLYEGVRAHEQSFKSTPLERSKSALPGFDDYDRERRAATALPGK